MSKKQLEELIKLNTQLRQQLYEERKKLKNTMPITYLQFAMKKGDYKPRPFSSKYEESVVKVFELIVNSERKKLIHSYSDYTDEELNDVQKSINNFYNSTETFSSNRSDSKLLERFNCSINTTQEGLFKIVSNAKGKNLSIDQLKEFFVAAHYIRETMSTRKGFKYKTTYKDTIISFLDKTDLCTDGGKFSEEKIVKSLCKKEDTNLCKEIKKYYLSKMDFQLFLSSLKIVRQNVEDEVKIRTELKSKYKKEITFHEEEFDNLIDKMKKLVTRYDRELTLKKADSLTEVYKSHCSWFNTSMRMLNSEDSHLNSVVLQNGAIIPEYMYLEGLKYSEKLVKLLSKFGNGFDDVDTIIDLDVQNKEDGKPKDRSYLRDINVLYRGVSLDSFLNTVVNLDSKINTFYENYKKIKEEIWRKCDFEDLIELIIGHVIELMVEKKEKEIDFSSSEFKNLIKLKFKKEIDFSPEFEKLIKLKFEKMIKLKFEKMIKPELEKGQKIDFLGYFLSEIRELSDELYDEYKKEHDKKVTNMLTNLANTFVSSIKGKILMDKSFCSASFSKGIADYFCKKSGGDIDVRLKIDLSEIRTFKEEVGTEEQIKKIQEMNKKREEQMKKLLYLDRPSFSHSMKHENEVVLKPGLKLKVIGCTFTKEDHAVKRTVFDITAEPML